MRKSTLIAFLWLCYTVGCNAGCTDQAPEQGLGSAGGVAVAAQGLGTCYTSINSNYDPATQTGADIRYTGTLNSMYLATARFHAMVFGQSINTAQRTAYDCKAPGDFGSKASCRPNAGPRPEWILISDPLNTPTAVSVVGAEADVGGNPPIPMLHTIELNRGVFAWRPAAGVIPTAVTMHMVGGAAGELGINLVGDLGHNTAQGQVRARLCVQ